MRRNYSNTAVSTTLSGGITDSATTLDVASATGYPEAPFTIQINSEVILVGAKSGTTFSSLTRGYDGTTAAAHSNGDAVEHVGIAEDMHAWGLVTNMSSSGWYTVSSPNVRDNIVSAGDLRASRIRIPHRITLTDVRIQVTTAATTAGDLIRIGIYDSVDDEPVNLILECGTVASDSTGVKTITGLSLDLAPGDYWFAVLIETGDCDIRVREPNISEPVRVHQDHMETRTARSRTGVTSGAMPDPFGTPTLDTIDLAISFSIQ